MEQKKITLLLPVKTLEAAERAAAAQGRTRHGFLCELIASQLGQAEEDKNTQEIQQIASLQRIMISIMAQWWSENNPEAVNKIRNIAARAGATI